MIYEMVNNNQWICPFLPGLLYVLGKIVACNQKFNGWTVITYATTI